ncbi:MAG: DNA topoisomerase VI subunit B, partial [Phycisphaerales bacterium]|nr:DNA topoisomerase VI subunit B [Phycisphaerales bacterium]
MGRKSREAGGPSLFEVESPASAQTSTREPAPSTVKPGETPIVSAARSSRRSSKSVDIAEPKPKAAKSRAKASKPVTAETMATRQRDISVSEFFAKNRHLLGFDNKRKALLTTVKEAVDNSLDACEEAHILPVIHVTIDQLAEERFRVTVRDNGPGIVRAQIPNIFGKLLYGSKFHRLKMSRGQQGIGISAAGMYGLLTTGKSVHVTSRTSPRKAAHHFQIQIDTRLNRPDVVHDDEVNVPWDQGTEVAIELEASYARGRQSVDEYIEQTAIANPHAEIQYIAPTGEHRTFERATTEAPPETKEIKPHPYGVELG